MQKTKKKSPLYNFIFQNLHTNYWDFWVLKLYVEKMKAML